MRTAYSFMNVVDGFEDLPSAFAKNGFTGGVGDGP